MSLLRRAWRALFADGSEIRKGGVAHNPTVPAWFTTEHCDRGDHRVDGLRHRDGATSGFYDVTEPPWSKYARPGERVVCDDCMHVSPQYRADYGAVSILDSAAAPAPGLPGQVFRDRRERAYQAFARERFRASGVCGPHCDDQVLHAPGECTYCDAYPELQAARRRIGVNFTGHSEPGKRPCFAERRRDVDTIHRWGGNAPKADPRSGATS